MSYWKTTKDCFAFSIASSFTFMFDFQTQLADYGHYLLLKSLRQNCWFLWIDLKSWDNSWTSFEQILDLKESLCSSCLIYYLSFVSVTSGTWNQSVLLKDQSTNHCTIEQCEPKFAESYKRQDLRKASSLYLKSFLNNTTNQASKAGLRKVQIHSDL